MVCHMFPRYLRPCGKASRLCSGGDMDNGGTGEIRAPLRWAGSKRKSLSTLRGFLPEEIKHYIEPFAGSACLAFMLRPNTLVLGDINPQLIEFYNYLREYPIELHANYSRISRDPKTYYTV